MAMKTLILRDEVQQFATAMERQLEKNDHKGPTGWKSCEAIELLPKLTEEVKELWWAVDQYTAHIKIMEALIGEKKFAKEEKKLARLGREVVREAADVGNLAMMVADCTEELE